MMNRSRTFRRPAFTLVEVLVSVTILVLILGILLSITGSVQSTWKRTQAKVSQFQASRNAFESINRRVRQATLNTYWDYDDPNKPTKYTRRSELRFISGPVAGLGLSSGFSGSTLFGHALFFQGPFGYSPANPKLDQLLNTWGYFVGLTNGKNDLPAFIASGTADKWRLRLYEFMERSEDLTVYNVTNEKPDNPSKEWFQKPVGTAANSHMLAENIIALVVRPKAAPVDGGKIADETDTIAPDYSYDSSGNGSLPDVQRAQLPPIVQVTLVAIDEDSATRIGNDKQKWDDIGKACADFFKSQSASMETKLQFDSKLGASGSLENYLVNYKPPISYRIYNTNINVSGSKWSGVTK